VTAPEPLTDLAPAAWLREHSRESWRTVGDLVPPGYDAHAIVRHRPDQRGGPPIACLDRRSLAALRDVVVQHTGTPDAGWYALWEGHPGLPTAWQKARRTPIAGRLMLLFAVPVAGVVELAADLAELQWSLDVQGQSWSPKPTPGMLAHLAAQARAEGAVRSPNAWWPEDRSWFTSTDVDGDDTVVAGSAAAVADVLAHPDLDAVAVSPEAPMPPRD